MQTAYTALQELLTLAGREPAADDAIVISGQDPVLRTNFLLGMAGAVYAARPPCGRSATASCSRV